MRRDPIGVVEAAYRIRGTDDDWLRGVRDAAAPELDAGFGVAACFFELWRGNGWGNGRLLADGCHRALEAGFQRSMTDPYWERHSVALLESGTFTCGTMTQYLRRHFLALRTTREDLLPNGIRDMLSVVGVNPSGVSCGLTVGLPRPIRMGKRATARWSRIAAHMAAGLRLRTSLATSRDVFAGAEAILDPDGACVHAERPAAAKQTMAGLRRSVRAVDRARGRLRRSDPDEALTIWLGLCAGRWSLLDYVDKDGRRFVLARRNDPAVAPLDSLTLAERQTVAYASLGHTNKLIAYELGVSETAISMRLSSAARKLGVRSRVELLRRYRERILGATSR
jgi:DNA-binding CsgD family transcriptional regulator